MKVYLCDKCEKESDVLIGCMDGERLCTECWQMKRGMIGSVPDDTVTDLPPPLGYRLGRIEEIEAETAWILTPTKEQRERPC